MIRFIRNLLQTQQTIELHSLNPLFKPYLAMAENIQEIWKFTSYISTVLPEPQADKDNLLAAIARLRSDVDKIQGSMAG